MRWTMPIVGLTGILMGSLLVGVAGAQEGFQPGFWQPVARVDPAQAVQLRLVNNSGASLEYGLTSDEYIIAEMEPGDVANLSVGSLPASLNISTVSRPPFDVLSLLYDVEASGNQVTVTVGIKDDVEGDRVVDIQESGGIYIY